jgi:uncharacterized glyoxalase superfamily protein PhnB
MANTVSPIPPGFHSLTIHLSVEGATAYIDFLKRAFNATEISRSPGPGGKLMHAQVKVGDSILMFADDMCQDFGMPAHVRGNLPFVIQLYVPDADATWKQAHEAGCQTVFEIGDQFWGDRYGQVRDPYGFTWAIATRKEELTPAQLQERAAKMMGGAAGS